MIKHKKQYPSLDALASAAMGKSAMADKQRMSREKTREWHGASWDDAKAKALGGDMAGAKRLSPTILDNVKRGVTIAPRLDPEYRIEGGQSIDISRFNHGEPECWLSMEEAATMPKQGVAVIVNLSTNGRMSADQLEKAGIAIGSAIIGLQAQGVGVTLYVSKFITSCGNVALISAPINPGGSPLDVAKLAVIVQPWCTRRLLFSLYETYDAAFRKDMDITITGGYGRPMELSEVARKIVAPSETTVITIEMQDAYSYPEGVAETIASAIY